MFLVTRLHLPIGQVLLSYGSKPNAELLLGYGFVQPDNPHDAIRITDMGLQAEAVAAGGHLRPHWPPGSLPSAALEHFGDVRLQHPPSMEIHGTKRSQRSKRKGKNLLKADENPEQMIGGVRLILCSLTKF